MDLYAFVSDHKQWTNHFTSFLALFITVAAWRVARDKALRPKEQLHLSWVALGLVGAGITFFHPVWGIWSGLLSVAFFCWAYALTSLKHPPVVQTTRAGSWVLALVSIGGMCSGWCPSLSMGPSMWPQASKTPSLSWLNTNAYRQDRPTYGDDIQFAAEPIAPLMKQAITPWGKGNFRKRVWGLPGDRVHVKALHVFINDHLVADCSNPTQFIQRAPDVWFCHASFPNGRTQRFVWGEVNGLYPDIEVTLGPGQLFVMGDNTVESGDSRDNGPILASWVVGQFNEGPTNQPWKAW